MRRILALLVRSLRQDARSLRPHLMRLLFLAPILLFLVIASAEGARAAQGLVVFTPIVYFNFVLITLAGTSYFASSITEEKEEMTLGLLRMAGVSPLALLFGKGVTRLFGLALLLSVQFPFTFLSVTLGGVSQGQVTATYAALMAYMLLLSSLGLLCSAYCRNSTRAATLATFLIAIVLFAPFILGSIWSALLATGAVTPGPWLVDAVDNVQLWATEVSAFSQIGIIGQSGFAASPISTQVIAHSIASVVLFVIAWLTFDLFNREEQTATPARGLIPARGWIPRTSKSPGKLRKTGRRPWKNAIAWKDFQFLTGGRTMLIIKSLMYALLVGGIVSFIAYVDFRGRIDPDAVAGVLFGVGFTGILLEVSLFASRIFAEETRWKTLPGLAMLPLSTRRLAYSKVLGCSIALIPAAVTLLAGFVVTPDALQEVANSIATEPGSWMGCATLIVFWHLIAYLSLRLKRGALPVAFLIMMFSWILFGMVMGVLSFWLLRGSSQSQQWIFQYLVPGICAAGECGITVLLHFGIGRQLRKLAAE